MVSLLYRSTADGNEVQLLQENFQEQDALEKRREGWMGCLDGLSVYLD
jgi:hypothetical protein